VAGTRSGHTEEYKLKTGIVFFLICFAAVRAFAEDQSFLYLDLNASGVITAEGKVLSATKFAHFQPTDRIPRNYVGIEYIRIFDHESSGTGLWPLRLATIDLNPHLELDFDPPFSSWKQPSASDVEFHPMRVDFNSDTKKLSLKLILHDFWIRFEPKLHPRMSLLLGHFDIPYGVNPVMSPRGGQFLMPPEIDDIGLKKDWGVRWKAPLGEYDYEVALTTGGGLGLHDPDWFDSKRPSAYLASARVGAPTYWRFQYGLSGLYGKLPRLMADEKLFGPPLERWRVNVDTFYKYMEHTIVMAQAGVGRNSNPPMPKSFHPDDTTTLAGHVVVDYIPPGYQQLEFKFQVKSIWADLGSTSKDHTYSVAEAAYSLSNSTTLRLDYVHDFRIPVMMGPKDDQFYFTLNYYE